jgi:hypothetical protein
LFSPLANRSDSANSKKKRVGPLDSVADLDVGESGGQTGLIEASGFSNQFGRVVDLQELGYRLGELDRWVWGDLKH